MVKRRGCYLNFLGSIVYNWSKVLFLNVVVHVIIIDQWIQVTVIDNRAIFVAVTSECCEKRLG